jgi:hypothetical protein
VFFSRDKLEIGEVVGISKANRQVSVRFSGANNGIWFDVGQIYPAVQQVVPENERPAAKTADAANAAPLTDGDAADSVEQKPYSLEAFREYRKRYEGGDASLADHRAEFARVQVTRDAFVANLKSNYDAQRLKVLAARFGCWDAKRNNKQQNAEHIHRVILQSFTLSGGVQYNPMSETLEDAVARQVESITDEQWQQHLTERAEQRKRTPPPFVVWGC